MQVVHSIRNRRFTESFADVNARLKVRAGQFKKTGERYAAVDTEEVIQRVLAIGISKGYHMSNVHVLTRPRKSTHHVVRMRFAALSGDGGADAGHPELVITNSYNGESSLRFTLGFFRLICSNGLTIPVAGFEDVNIDDRRKHIAGPKMDTFQRDLDHRIVAAFEALGSLQSKFAALAAIPVTPEKERVIVDQLGLTKRQAVQLEVIRGGGFGRDNEPNLWALYNAVNEAIRRTQRSEYATEQRNVHLLSAIENAAKAA